VTATALARRHRPRVVIVGAVDDDPLPYAAKAPVGFGGMRFAGLKDERLARSHVMILEPQWVASLLVCGAPVWPERGP